MAAHWFESLLARRSSEIRVALRVAIAGTLTFALARWLHLSQGYWAVITSVIVVQTSLGGSVKAAVERSLGTLAGAVFGSCVGLLVPHGDVVGLGAAVAIALVPTSFLAAVDPRFRVAPITVLIVLLAAPPQVVGTLIAAAERIAEIALGNLIGVAVSLLVVPARAHHAVVSLGAEIVEVQADLLAHLLATHDGGNREIARLQTATRAVLNRLEVAIDEAKRERRMHLSSAVDPDPLMRTLLRLRHDLVMVGRATTAPAPEPLHGRIAPSLDTLSTRLCGAMHGLAAAMKAGTAPPKLSDTAEALQDYAAAIEDARTEGLTIELKGDSVGRVFSLRFALQQLYQDLRDLADRVEEAAAAAAR